MTSLRVTLVSVYVFCTGASCKGEEAYWLVLYSIKCTCACLCVGMVIMAARCPASNNESILLVPHSWECVCHVFYTV